MNEKIPAIKLPIALPLVVDAISPDTDGGVAETSCGGATNQPHFWQ
jgi:hypothetical protein